jgi:hypothetical protein
VTSNIVNLIGNIPSPGKMGPTVIDKGQPIEPIGSRLRDHTRTFDSGVRVFAHGPTLVGPYQG